MSLRKPTIREVATRAGVSIGTVSHVLTGRKAVRPATRTAIDAAIHDLGYLPDSAARALIAPPAAASPARTLRRAAAHHRRLSLCADHTARRRCPSASRRPHPRRRPSRRRSAAAAANVAVTAAGLGPPLALSSRASLRRRRRRRQRLGAGACWPTAASSYTHSPADTMGRLSRCFILVEANGSRTIVNEPLQVPAAALAAMARDQLQCRSAPTPSISRATRSPARGFQLLADGTRPGLPKPTDADHRASTGPGTRPSGLRTAAAPLFDLDRPAPARLACDMLRAAASARRRRTGAAARRDDHDAREPSSSLTLSPGGAALFRGT